MSCRPFAGGPFGRTADGKEAKLYTLESSVLRVAITDFGGRIVAVEAPDRQGRRGHVVLGFDTVTDYEAASAAAFGALLGRNANRIAGGRFTLEGLTYQLSKIAPDANLHGGKCGFDKLYWEVSQADRGTLSLQLTSKAGDQGFPGKLTVSAVYRVESNTLWLDLTATTTEPTPVNLSAHPYFNLAGPKAGDMLSHVIGIAAEYFLPTDARQIPTGEIRPVAVTPFDFRDPAAAGARIRQPDPQLLIGRGYDHYFILAKNPEHQVRHAARAFDPASGRALEVLTNQPGLQFYTGNNLNGSIAGRGGIYRQSAGFAFEPQGFPDAVNQPQFPTTVLRPGETYRNKVGYRFTTE